MKLEKFVERLTKNLNANSTVLFAEGTLLFVCYLLTLISKDLEMLNTLEFSKFAVIFCSIGILLYFLEVVILFICKKVLDKRNKKLEIEKIIEEESKKD